jgi:hypothetical protein
MTTQRTRTLLTALAAAAALTLLAAGGAQAKRVELTGSSTVTPSAQATQFLADHGVAVAPTGAAVAEGDGFVFPIAAGFANARTFNGVLAHRGGLRFSKGERSAVLRRFVAVRHRRAGAVLLAQVRGLRGGCARLRAKLQHFVLPHAGALRGYCAGGRVIVLARLTNLGKELSYDGALLSANLELSGQAARLLNKLAGRHAVSAGAPLGTAESRVTVVD